MARKPKAEDFIEEEIEYVSKTQMKVEAKEIRDLGELIVNMSTHQRAKLPLNEDLVHAFKVADKIRNTREGYRRQLQFIGRLLRNTDVDAIRQTISELTNTNKQAERALQNLEAIRQQLIDEGDSKVNELVAEYPGFERQKLRQLIKKTIKQQQLHPEQMAPAYKELFQYIKEVIQ